MRQQSKEASIHTIKYFSWLKKIFFGNVRENLMKALREMGSVQFQFKGQRYIFTSSLDSSIELSSPNNYDEDRGRFIQSIKELKGEGAPTESDAHRKIAGDISAAWFTQQAIENYYDSMYEVVENLLAKWHNIPENYPIILNKDVCNLTSDILRLCAFNERLNSFYKNDSLFNEEVILYLETSALYSFLPDSLARFIFLIRPRQLKAMDHLIKKMDAILEERLHSKTHEEGAKDLLNLMLKSTDKTGKRFSEETIHEQLLAFIYTGIETTSSLISASLYYIIHAPDVLEKAYMELDQVFGPNLKGKPPLNKLSNLTYLSQILKESLRLHPPLQVIRYTPRVDQLFLGQYPVKKGDAIILHLPNLHREKGVWGEKADVFNPENFSPDVLNHLSPQAFKPFGLGGVSESMGNQFALLEAKLALSLILYHYKIHPTQELLARYQQEPSIASNAMSVTLEKRSMQDRLKYTPQIEELKESVVKKQAVEISTFAVETTHQTPLLILYGSNLGLSEGIARRIAKDADVLGFKVILCCLDDWLKRLPTEGATIIVTSTYNGLPPDNAQAFANWLEETPIRFTSCRFALFGCGNTLWRTYQSFPLFVEKNLLEKEAVQIYQRGESDGNVFGEESFETWYAGLWPTLFQQFSLEPLKIEDTERVELEMKFLILKEAEYQKPLRENTLLLKVDLNRELQRVSEPFSSKKSTRHIQLELPKGVSYSPGDYLAVYPQNDPELIKQIFEHFNADPMTAIELKENQHTFLPVGRAVLVEEILTYYVELQEVITRRHLKLLADYADRPLEKDKLLKLAEIDNYKDQVLFQKRSLFEMLNKFKSCKIPFSLFISLLPPLKPRFYSISSSHLVHPHRCSITVGVLAIPKFNGVCSNYLARLPSEAHLEGYIDSQKQHFTLPKNKQHPIVMICAGTGFAPFRGFLQELEMFFKEQKGCKAVLFFGIKHPEVDFIYKEELMKWMGLGLLELHMAYSRLEGVPKCYVQDKLWEQKERVWELISEGAIFYVCGEGSRMAPGVQKTIQKIYSEKTGCDQEESESWMTEMIQQKRYIIDSWNTTPTLVI
jgi:cytochrome P450/NADPH-cytochrome P450 reductase